MNQEPWKDKFFPDESAPNRGLRIVNIVIKYGFVSGFTSFCFSPNQLVRVKIA